MKRRATMTEEQLAGDVVAWLRTMDWEVYQEVQVRTHGHRADIVATRGPLLWVIEAKLQYGTAVIEQARRWQHAANYVSVATPYGNGNLVLDEYLKARGIGHLQVVDPDQGYVRTEHRIEPRLHRRVTEELRRALRDEHKTWAAAGNNRSERWTPYQATCRALLDRVRVSPGLSIKQALDGLAHHYHSESTARSSLLKWAEGGKVPGVEARRDGRKVTLWPKAGASDVKALPRLAQVEARVSAMQLEDESAAIE